MQERMYEIADNVCASGYRPKEECRCSMIKTVETEARVKMRTKRTLAEREMMCMKRIGSGLVEARQEDLR